MGMLFPSRLMARWWSNPGCLNWFRAQYNAFYRHPREWFEKSQLDACNVLKSIIRISASKGSEASLQANCMALLEVQATSPNSYPLLCLKQ
eukprot:scaffold166355_cov18-Tisochrysis_lutea.AAC.3